MYTAYMIFFIVLAISFITGSIIVFVEHKQKKDTMNKKHMLIDRDIV